MSAPADTEASLGPPRSVRWVFRVSVVLIALVSAGFVVNAVIVGNRTTALKSLGEASVIAYSPGHRIATHDVRLRRLGGGPPVSVGGPSGRPTVVNFFASWCTACQREIRAVAAVARARKVPFVGVDTDETSPGQALALLRAAHATYPVGMGTGTFAGRYGAEGLPTTAFLNARGRIVALELGAVRRHELARLVADLAAGRPL